MNILEHAQKILYDRAEEQDRKYGPIDESIEKTAKIATLLGNKQLTPEDVSNVMIALKLARESYSHKTDNILDAIVYMAHKSDYQEKHDNGMQDYLDKNHLNSEEI